MRKTLKTAILLVLTLAMTLGLCGCGNHSVSDPTEPMPDPENSMAAGQTLQLTADRLPDGQIQWQSSDPQRATVDSNGAVTALTGRGEVTITATCGDQSQSWNILLCENTAYGNVHLVSGDEKLTIGIWNGSYHIFDFERIEALAASGVDQIIGVAEKWQDATGIEGMLDRAEMTGISVIVDLRDWDGQTVPAYVDHPALGGFLMYDEPCATEFEKLAALKEKFEAVMPEDVPFFINLFPESCSYESLFGDDYDKEKVDYEQYYLDYFVDTLDPFCISYDTYPLQEGGYIRSAYYHNMDIMSNKAKEAGVPFWYTLLTVGHNTTDGRYITPTDAEMRWQMSMAMTFGAVNLTHYTYTTTEEGYDTIVEFGTWEPTQIYYDMQKVNLEYRAWEDIYMSYTWQGVAKLDVGQKNQLMTGMEYDLPFTKTGCLTGVSSKEDLLIGYFTKDGSDAYMITNAGNGTKSDKWARLHFTMEETTVTLQLADGNYRCAAVIENGQIRYVPVSADNTVQITIGAYNGAFVIPVTQ